VSSPHPNTIAKGKSGSC